MDLAVKDAAQREVAKKILGERVREYVGAGKAFPELVDTLPVEVQVTCCFCESPRLCQLIFCSHGVYLDSRVQWHSKISEIGAGVVNSYGVTFDGTLFQWGRCKNPSVRAFCGINFNAYIAHTTCERCYSCEDVVDSSTRNAHCWSRLF